jgi:pilus assembly protein FimV
MNKKLLITTLGVLLTTAQPAAYALAISDIKLNSSLNQTLEATVEIISATIEELNSLSISVSRLPGKTPSLHQWPGVKVELVRVDGGKSYLKITSKESVREPVLNFLLELDWATGHIKREYSLLINPQL